MDSSFSWRNRFYSRIQIPIVKAWKVSFFCEKRTIRSITSPSGVFREFQSTPYLFYARLRDFDRIAKYMSQGDLVFSKIKDFLLHVYAS